MVFGMTGLEIRREFDTIQKRTIYASLPERIPDKGKKLESLLKKARKDAKSRGMSLEEYFKLPKDHRSY